MNHYWLGTVEEVLGRGTGVRPVLQSVFDFAYIAYPCTIHVYPSFTTFRNFREVLDHLNDLKGIVNHNPERTSVTIILHKFHYEPSSYIPRPIDFIAGLSGYKSKEDFTKALAKVTEFAKTLPDTAGYNAGLGETIRGITEKSAS